MIYIITISITWIAYAIFLIVKTKSKSFIIRLGLFVLTPIIMFENILIGLFDTDIW